MQRLLEKIIGSLGNTLKYFRNHFANVSKVFHKSSKLMLEDNRHWDSLLGWFGSRN
jgi:hypothetical protein